jgi:hypothetical protein
MMRCAALLLLSLFSASHCLAQRDFGVDKPELAWQRTLQQASTNTAAGNCTPPRTREDAKKPFCFVPETISPQARQFLSQAAAAVGPFGVEYTTDPLQQAATVKKLRADFVNFSANTTEAAKKKYIQSIRNGTIGGVPVMYAVPKGVNATPPADTKVLLYVHGRCAAGSSMCRSSCVQHARSSCALELCGA